MKKHHDHKEMVYVGEYKTSLRFVYADERGACWVKRSGEWVRVVQEHGGWTAEYMLRERGETMRYFKRDKFVNRPTVPLSKGWAKLLLSSYYDDDVLNDIFDSEKAFRLQTDTATFWTEDAQGRVPEAGFYGVVG